MGGMFSSPKVQKAPPVAAPIEQPVVQQELVDRQAADIMRRRRGSAATRTGAADTGDTSGSVAAKTLLGQ